VARRRQERSHDPASHPELVEPRSGDVVFDLEAAWHDPAPRDELLRDLTGRGVRTGFLVADVMPEQHPEWFSDVVVDRFGRFLRAHLRWSDHVASISRSTTRDLAAVAGGLGRTRLLRVVHLTMGADFADPARLPRSRADATRRMLLSVGSLEPRKNHALLLDVFDRLRDRHPDVELVLVGRETDLSAPLVERIRTHADHGRRLRWEEHLDDAGLAAAYAEAFLVLVPSRYEGYGIPVVEALSRGVPTIAATGGALTEAGGDTAEYASADDPGAWAELVERHLTDPEHHRSRRDLAAAFRPPTWEAAGHRLAQALFEMGATSA
jgi:glycosyltransferase involved in cell wall biosynthesis